MGSLKGLQLVCNALLCVCTPCQLCKPVYRLERGMFPCAMCGKLAHSTFSPSTLTRVKESQAVWFTQGHAPLLTSLLWKFPEVHAENTQACLFSSQHQRPRKQGSWHLLSQPESSFWRLGSDWREHTLTQSSASSTACSMLALSSGRLRTNRLVSDHCPHPIWSSNTTLCWKSDGSLLQSPASIAYLAKEDSGVSRTRQTQQLVPKSADRPQGFVQLDSRSARA